MIRVNPLSWLETHRGRYSVVRWLFPRLLAAIYLIAFISWGVQSDVLFELTAKGAGTLLTITHRRAPNRDVLLSVSAGWHAHVDVLEARLAGTDPAPHWDNWVKLRAEYDQRFPE